MIYALVGIVVVMALGLLVFGIRSRRPKSQEEIFERMGRYATRDELLDVSGGREDGPGRIARSVEQIVEGRGIAEKAAAALARADVRMTIGEFLTIRLLGGIVGFAVGYLWLGTSQPAVGVVIGCIFSFFGATLPVIWLWWKARARMKKFINQLGDTITLMANSLRAGYSLLQTMEMVSREAPDPIATEFRRVVREVGLGISQTDAMVNMLRRVPSEDLDLLVTAIGIQHEVGGNLAQILQVIGHTIRERVRIKGEIAVLTAQQQISGYMISALPVGLSAVIFVISPDYMSAMFVWPWICMPIGGAISVTIGFFVMKRITAIEV